MIAYNKTKLDHLRLLAKVRHWYARQLVSAEQLVASTARYAVDFYTPNLFIKIGLFVFTWVSVGAAVGLFSLFFMGLLDSVNGDVAIATLCLLFAGGCILLLETLIRQRKLYRAGIDEALLYAALLFTGCAIGSLLPGWFGNTSSAFLSFSMLMMPVLVAATIRYADTFVAILLSFCCYVVFFLLLLKLGAIAKLIMPFAMMLLSVVIYLVAKRLQQNTSLRYWQTAIAVFECIALLVFYLSGNYYVIRESSIAFFDLRLLPGSDIPLAGLFYLFTAVVPILYVFYGLKRKERLLLWMGLIVVAASAVTFKYYFSTGHPEVILTLAGILLIGVAYSAIRYLKTPKHGLTFEEEPDEDNFLKTNAEALLQARTFGHAANAPVRTTEFGGGSSGGGGATGGW